MHELARSQKRLSAGQRRVEPQRNRVHPAEPFAQAELPGEKPAVVSESAFP